MRLRRQVQPFLEKSLSSLLDALHLALRSEEYSRRPGPLQTLDARVKLVGLAALMAVALFSRHGKPLAAAFVLLLALAILAGIRGRDLLRHVSALLVFTLCIGAPALYFTPGQKLQRGYLLISEPGLHSLLFLVGRTQVITLAALLLIATTPWTALLAAARRLGAPPLLTSLLAMTYRYIFLLLEMAQNMLPARQSRRVGAWSPAQNRRVLGSCCGALLVKSMDTGEAVHDAMLARGFRGNFPELEPGRMQARDWGAAAVLAGITALLLWWAWY